MLNLRMGKAVCEAVNHSPCAHLVYVSSDAVYDAHQIPLDEESTREPVSLYALMHTAREMMIGTSVAKESIPFCILRPTSIYGSGDSHRNYGPNQFVRSAVAEGRIVLFGNGEERRSHVYIDDAIEVLLQCVLHRSSGTLNLAEARAISYRNLADLISGFCPHPVAIDHASRRVPTIHRRYKPTQVFRFLYNLGRPIGPIVHRTFVVSALRHAFPEFEPTPIAAGIERFLEETLRARAKTPEERS
jgi:UDP-glucose 4-epimerase